jgi:plastocyanin
MPTSRKHPFVLWVIFAGLVFSGSDLLYGILPDLRNLSLFDPFIGLVAAFVILCYVSAFGVLFTQRRWSFVSSVVVALGFAVPSLFVYPAPTQFTTFVIATTSVPILFLVATLSILSLVNLKQGLDRKKYLSSPASSGGVLTAAILILVILSVGFGAFSSHHSSDEATTIFIVAGASSPSNPTGHFAPSSVTLVIGVNNTVTWINEDYSIHTVTSNAGVFDSGLMNSGDRWSYTFSTPGVYSYHCAIHPYMIGTVIVKGSS